MASKRQVAVALGVIDGKSPVEACVDAGYSKSTARSKAWDIVRQPEVRKLIVEFGATLSRTDLSNMARARLAEALLDTNTNAKDLVPAIRTALEHGGEIGANREIMHKHQVDLSPAVQALLAKRMVEIAAEQGKVIDAEIVQALPAHEETSQADLRNADRMESL